MALLRGRAVLASCVQGLFPGFWMIGREEEWLVEHPEQQSGYYCLWCRTRALSRNRKK